MNIVKTYNINKEQDKFDNVSDINTFYDIIGKEEHMSPTLKSILKESNNIIPIKIGELYSNGKRNKCCSYIIFTKKEKSNNKNLLELTNNDIETNIDSDSIGCEAYLSEVLNKKRIYPNIENMESILANRIFFIAKIYHTDIATNVSNWNDICKFKESIEDEATILKSKWLHL